MKNISYIVVCSLLLVCCTHRSAQVETATDTCAVAVVDTVVPVYQHVEAIDLGLSVLWADRNLGASEPADCGGYYPSLEAQDTINALLGNGWRLPTAKETDELFGHCAFGNTCYMKNAKDLLVKGRLFSYKKGASIFMPAAGYLEGQVYYYYSTSGVYMTSSHTYNDQYCKGKWGGYWDDEEEVGTIPYLNVTQLSSELNCKYTIRPVKDK